MNVITLLNDSNKALTKPISAERAKNTQTVMEFLEVYSRRAQRYIEYMSNEIADWDLKLLYQKKSKKNQFLINNDYISNLPTHQYLKFKDLLKHFIEDDSINLMRCDKIIVQAPPEDLKQQIEYLEMKTEDIQRRQLTQDKASTLTLQINEFKNKC